MTPSEAIHSSEGLSVGTKLAKCTPFLERTLPLCLFILESSGKDLYGELPIKGPRLLLLSCPCADIRHQSGDPGFLVLFSVFTLPGVGCGVCLCTLSGSACVLLSCL